MDALKNWKTTAWAVAPLVAYGLNHFGLWPTSIPLPPLEQVWPALLAVFGVGWVAKDHDVTGGTR